MRRWLIAAVAVCSAGLVAAGCGSSGGSSTGGGGSASASGGTLTWNTGTEPKSLDPDLVQTLYDANVSDTEFIGLERFGKDNNVRPQLEQSHTVSPDGKTWTFKLRDANWSDGTPITASDFVYGIDRALDSKTAAPYASYLSPIVGACEYLAVTGGKKASDCPAPQTDGSVGAIGVKATDAHTLTFTLNQTTPWFQLLLALNVTYPVPHAVVEKCGVKWTDPAACSSLVVSGPFKATSWQHGTSLTVTKNPKYYDASTVKLDSVKFQMVSNGQSAYRQYTTGQLDGGFATKMIDPADVSRASKDAGFRKTLLLATQYLYLNSSTNPALKDKRVRQAIALLVNRPAIIQALQNPGDTPSSTYAPKGIAGSDTILGGDRLISDPTKTDVTKAKQLLSEAGYKSGTALDLAFTTETGSGQAVIDEVQSDLQAGGVTVKEDPKPTFADLLSNGVGLPPLPASIGGSFSGWVQDYNEATDFYQILTCGQNVPGGFNSASYCNHAYDSVFQKAVSTQDDSTRWGLEKQMEDALTGPDGDFPAIPLYQEADITLVNPKVKNWFETNGGIVYFDQLSKS